VTEDFFPFLANKPPHPDFIGELPKGSKKAPLCEPRPALAGERGRGEVISPHT